MKVYLFALLYGDYPVMHARLLDGFSRFVPAEVQGRVWCNALSAASQQVLFNNMPKHWSSRGGKENVPKYKIMQELFAPVKEKAADDDWVVWFDDDSYIVDANWLTLIKARIAANPEVRYMGQPWFVHHLPGQWDFIKESKWFHGKEAEIIKGRPGVWFAQGSYWWLRVDALKELGWPDSRLSHNGGDTLLGEAVRQQGWPFTRLSGDKHHISAGVRLNDAPRRGRNEIPAGSSAGVRR